MQDGDHSVGDETTGICGSCGGPFRKRHPAQAYCSSRCKTIARRKRRNPDVVLSDRRCEWCGVRLVESARSHAKFCSDKCRLAAFNVKLCVYCGEPANGRDHVIPRAFQQRIEDFGWAKRRKLIVPACGECNSTAGSKVFLTLREKRRYIHDRYRERYRKLLEAPNWTQEEIDELGPTLRTTVVRSQHAKDLIRARLAWRRS